MKLFLDDAPSQDCREEDEKRIWVEEKRRKWLKKKQGLEGQEKSTNRIKRKAEAQI